VGPVSNFLVVLAAVGVLSVIALTSKMGSEIVHILPRAYPNHLDELGAQTESFLLPLSLLVYDLMTINVVLAVFNLIPLPPLDGSHVLRHFLSGAALQTYDRVGWIGLMLLVYLGGVILGRIIYPVLNVFYVIMMNI
jgi:Zn-dependent protease